MQTYYCDTCGASALERGWTTEITPKRAKYIINSEVDKINRRDTCIFRAVRPFLYMVCLCSTVREEVCDKAFSFIANFLLFCSRVTSVLCGEMEGVDEAAKFGGGSIMADVAGDGHARKNEEDIAPMYR